MHIEHYFGTKQFKFDIIGIDCCAFNVRMIAQKPACLLSNLNAPYSLNTMNLLEQTFMHQQAAATTGHIAQKQRNSLKYQSHVDEFMYFAGDVECTAF